MLALTYTCKITI